MPRAVTQKSVAGNSYVITYSNNIVNQVSLFSLCVVHCTNTCCPRSALTQQYITNSIDNAAIDAVFYNVGVEFRRFSIFIIFMLNMNIAFCRRVLVSHMIFNFVSFQVRRFFTRRLILNIDVAGRFSLLTFKIIFNFACYQVRRCIVSCVLVLNVNISACLSLLRLNIVIDFTCYQMRSSFSVLALMMNVNIACRLCLLSFHIIFDFISFKFARRVNFFSKSYIRHKTCREYYGEKFFHIYHNLIALNDKQTAITPPLINDLILLQSQFREFNIRIVTKIKIKSFL